MDQDRPIDDAANDALNRGPFVERISNSLVTANPENPRLGTATGLVIGLAGAWGTGKSSILNLIEKHLNNLYDPILVVRFDPWLISGRDQLVKSYLEELASVIQKLSPSKDDSIKQLIETIYQYRDMIGESLKFTLKPLEIPLADKIIDVTNAALTNRFQSEERPLGLHETKIVLTQKIKELNVPIVVLIDEVDRIEDVEVRALVQLVKAVADFPNISYLIAYDLNRLVQALGADAPEHERRERGRLYIEKIVQLQIPIPKTFQSEFIKLIRLDIDRNRDKLKVPQNFFEQERYLYLEEILIDHIVQNPRDVKRLFSAFSGLRYITIGEVDWIDCLAYASIMCKFPELSDKISREPRFFTDHILMSEIHRSELIEEKLTEKNQYFLGEHWKKEKYSRVLMFLFPIIAKKEGYHKPSLYFSEDIDRLSNYRALSILIRQGLPPGTWPFLDVRNVVKSVAEGRYNELEAALDTDRGSDLIVAINGHQNLTDDGDFVRFWLNIGEWLKKPDCSIPKSRNKMWSNFYDFSELMEGVLRRNEILNPHFEHLINILFQNKCFEILSSLLWKQAYAHGLFGLTQRNGDVMLLDAERILNECSKLSDSLMQLHLSTNWVFANWTLTPVYALMAFHRWDEKARHRMMSITENEVAFRAMVMMIFGRNYIVSRSTIEDLMGLEVFAERMRKQLDLEKFSNLDPSLRESLEKAKFFILEGHGPQN